MDNARELRARAERYRQMRGIFTDGKTQEVLAQLAREFDLRAERIDACNEDEPE